MEAINRDCIFEVFTVGNIYKREPGEYTSTQLQCAWEAWQAAEAQAVWRCADICEQIAHKYLSTPRMSDVADECKDSIRRAFL